MLGKCLLPPAVVNYTGLLYITEPETPDNITGCMSTHCEQLSRLCIYFIKWKKDAVLQVVNIELEFATSVPWLRRELWYSRKISRFSYQEDLRQSNKRPWFLTGQCRKIFYSRFFPLMSVSDNHICVTHEINPKSRTLWHCLVNKQSFLIVALSLIILYAKIQGFVKLSLY